MAQSKGFFGLRKGSTKSLTFSTLRGKQITKDRVFGGTNPKTLAQAVQRSKVATYTQLWKVVAPICDHAFEGLSQGDANRRAFMSANLKLSDQMVLPKGGKEAVVTTFVVSDGSLPPITINEQNDFSNLVFPAESFLSPSLPLTRQWYEEFLKLNSMLRVGDQLTFVTIVDSENRIEYLGHPVMGAKLQYQRMIIPQVGPDVESADYVNINGDNWVPYDKDGVLSIKSANAPFEIDSINGIIHNVDASADYAPYGQLVGVILSRFENGKWRRSPCTIKAISPTGFALRVRQQFLLTYTKSYNSESPLYLNEGDEI